MLQNIRDRATGWLAWVIVILITIPFAFWGLDSYLQNDSERLVATIGDAEITLRDHQNNIQQQKQRVAETMGRIDPAAFDRPEVRRKLLDRQIDDQLLSMTVMDEKYRISDALLAQEIQFSPAFRGDNGFDAAKYERLLKSQGESAASFEQRLRIAMAVDQLRIGVALSEPVLPNELDRLIQLDRQEREIAWLRLAVDAFRDPTQIDDTAVSDYYDSHRDAFQTEEKVKLAYLELSVAELAKQIPVDAVAIREYFDNHHDQYVRPEQREAAHIMIAVAPDADEAAAETARQRIAELRLELDQGADFAELATRSDDVSSAQNGGNLGMVDRGTMGDEFDRVLFALGEGDVSEPVRTEFGWHLVKVMRIHPTGTKTFEDSLDAVTADWRRSRAEEDFYALGERLAEASFSQPDNLLAASEETGLPVQTSDFLSRDASGDGLFGNAKVLKAAFGDEVLGQGNNSEVIEIAPDHLVVLRVLEHQPARPKALDEVREEVRRQVATERAVDRLREVADQIAATLRDGGEVQDRAGLSRNPATWVRRGSQELDVTVANKAFSMSPPAAGGRSVDVTTLASGDMAVVVVSGVRDPAGTDITDELRETYRGSLARVGAERAIRDLVMQLRSERDIRIFEENI
ncbi:MAG: SurA N-terminal domain-containing protein [Chromatiales bacterium]|nr:SurA N-terminal domain-containing protein [Gammaproteobacteria bacterium]MCP5352501.1 SurA N-terminal domain-containing protein [Chromatiales bacterium]